MNNRGRAITYIIIAIVVVLLVVSIFIFRDNLFGTKSIAPEIQEVHDLASFCVVSTAIDAIQIIGNQGGYFQLPNSYLDTGFSKIAYGYNLGQKVLPSKSTIEQEISDFMQLTLPICFDEEIFPEFEIQTVSPIATTKINDETVEISVTYPISATVLEKTHDLPEKYKDEILIRLGKIHDVANEIIDKEAGNPDLIDITYLTESEFDIAILPYTNDEIVYAITDENPATEDILYTFSFANKLR
jgi:hypothetical protein